MYPPGQDWEVVVLRKQKEAPKHQHQVSEYTSRARKLEADVHSGATEEAPPAAPLLKLSRETSRELIQSRVSHKFTQEQLAHKCNLPVVVIKTLESGGVVQDRSVLAKVNRVLGTHLRFDQ